MNNLAIIQIGERGEEFCLYGGLECGTVTTYKTMFCKFLNKKMSLHQTPMGVKEYATRESLDDNINWLTYKVTLVKALSKAEPKLGGSCCVPIYAQVLKLI